MKDPKKVREKVIEDVDLTSVMLEYKVGFVFDPRGSDEVQFRCPFHGRDNKPSARLYKATKSCFCWVCRKKWDVISFIMDSETMEYRQAIPFIVKKYNVDLSDIPDEPEIHKPKSPEVSDNQVDMLRIKNTLRSHRGVLPFDKYVALSTAYFMLKFKQTKGLDVTESISKLQTKLEQTCQVA